MLGAKAAIVLRVKRQQSGARRSHRGQVRVVGHSCQIARCLLRVAEVFQETRPRAETGIAGDRIGKRDARIERANKNRLPAAAGKAGDGYARGIGIFQRQQHIKTSGHGQIKGRYTACAAEVQLVHAIVLVIGSIELSHAQPFRIQHQHAAPGQIDAANLFVRDRFSDVFMAIDTQRYRNFAGQVFWFVEQGGYPKARHRFVTQFLNPIARPAFRRFQPHNFDFALAPLSGFANVTAFVDELLYNRMYSLLFEGGHRWVDARRYGRLGQLPRINTAIAEKTFPYVMFPIDECNER